MKQTISTIRQLVFCALLALAALRVEGKTIYVNAAAIGANNGNAWPDAFTTVYAALDAARYGDQIWVTRGTYYPTAGADRKISLMLKNGVQLLGGFAGIETAAAQRNWRRNATILSGDIGVRNDSLDNTFRVLRGSGLDSTTVLDGFVVERGNANIDGFRTGAGLFLLADENNLETRPILANCIFRRNIANAGGAVYLKAEGAGQCTPQFRFCQFMLNYAIGSVGRGSCLFFDCETPNSKKINLSDCLFTENTGSSGVIDHICLSAIAFQRDSFIRNTLTGAGALLFLHAHGGVLLSDCVFRQNKTTDGGSIASIRADSVVFEGLVFENNTAGNGLSGTRINRALFVGNRMSGGLCGAAHLSNTTIMNNRANTLIGTNFGTLISNTLISGNQGNTIFSIQILGDVLRKPKPLSFECRQSLFYDNEMKMVESLYGSAIFKAQSCTFANNRPADTLAFRLRRINP